MLTNLSFSRFKAYYRVQKPLKLPRFTGSTFRGALGHAFGRVRYGLKNESCRDCSARSECRYGNLYAYLFESPADHPFIAETSRSLKMKHQTYPQPFALDPPAGGPYRSGELLILPFTLIGRAIECFPFVACALSCLGQNRLGRHRDTLLLEAVADGLASEDGEEALIYEGKTGRFVGSPQIIDYNLVLHLLANTFDSVRPTDRIRIRFLTPFRFKNENKLAETLSFSIFMRNVFRRLTLLSVHSPLDFDIDFKRLLVIADNVKTVRATLRWSDWERYSNRQKTRMKLGGILGDIDFSGPLGDFLPFIKLCEFLNVGKNAAFGLGKFSVEGYTG